MTEETKHIRKSHFWLGFSIGIIVGLVIMTGVALLNQKMQWESWNLLHALIPPEKNNNDTVVQIVENNTYYHPISKSAPVTTEKKDSSTIDSILLTEKVDDENSTFFIEENDEDIWKDRGVSNRTIPVSILKNVHDSIASEKPTYTHFNVEQWSSPIKNKISYQRSTNTLKMKGINIQQIQIFFYHGEYYLSFEQRYYAIPENNQFERIQESTLPIIPEH